MRARTDHGPPADRPSRTVESLWSWATTRAASLPGVLGWSFTETSLTAALVLLLAFRVAWFPGPAASVDLPTFHLAARAAVEGESPYSPELHAEASRALGRHVFPVISPPPAVVLLAPFAWLPYGTAAQVFLILNFLLALPILAFALEQSGFDPSSRAARSAIVLLWLGGAPFLGTLLHGQINLVVLALICFGWRADRNGVRPWFAGGCFGLASILKLSPALLVLVLLVRRRWAAFAAASATILFVTALAALLLPAEAWTDWSDRVAPALGYGRAVPGLYPPESAFNQSLHGLLAGMTLGAPTRWLAASPLGDLRLIAYLLASALVLVTLWFAGRSSEREAAESTDLAFSVALCAMFLVSPLSWEHHLVFVFPALVVAWRLALRASAHHRAALMAATPLVTLALPLGRQSESVGWAALVDSPRLLGVGLIWCCLLLLASRSSVPAAKDGAALSAAAHSASPKRSSPDPRRDDAPRTPG